MAQVLYCGEDAKCPCAALTGGEMNFDELFGMDSDDGCVPDPLRDPSKKGYIPVEMLPDPAGPCMIPASQREYHHERIPACTAHRIKSAVAVSPTLLRYRPATA